MSVNVIVGGGSWGSAIASSLQRAQQPVTILARSQQAVDMLTQGKCPKLPNCAPIAPLAATTDHTCLAGATVIFVAVPVKANAESFDMIKPSRLDQRQQLWCYAPRALLVTIRRELCC